MGIYGMDLRNIRVFFNGLRTSMWKDKDKIIRAICWDTLPGISASAVIIQFLYLFLEYCTFCLHWLCVCVKSCCRWWGMGAILNVFLLTLFVSKTVTYSEYTRVALNIICNEFIRNIRIVGAHYLTSHNLDRALN